MIVKNIGKKVIGFGKIFIVPDETAPLPAGYDESHPTVEFYIAQGYLKAVDEKDYTPEEPPEDDEPPVNLPPTETEEEKAARLEKEAADAKAAAEKAAANAKEAEKAAKIKALDRMNLDPLRDLAKSLGIAVEDKDTIAILKGKIIEKYNAE